MTKNELLYELKSLIYGGRSYVIVCKNDGYIRLYDPADSFTAFFIADAIKRTGDSFTGITVDYKSRPYMLFTY